MKISITLFVFGLFMTQFTLAQNVAVQDHDLQMLDLYFESESQNTTIDTLNTNTTRIVDIQIGTEKEIMGSHINQIQEWIQIKKDLKNNKTSFYKDNRIFITKVVDTIYLDI
ncbi:hypothetical protein [Aquimarina rhabdastrellae]